MQVAPAHPSPLTAPLTWREICAAYPDQWVGLVDVVENSARSYDIRSARVVSHGPDRAKVLLELRPYRADHADVRHLFTGRLRAPFPRVL